MAFRSGTLRGVLAALLVVLAGCGGVAQAPSTPRAETVTPAPVPTDSPTPPPGRASVPAPLAGEVPNATALAHLHAESLAGRAYRLGAYVRRTWEVGPDHSVQTRLDRRSYRVQSDGTYRAARALVVVGSGPSARLPRWEAYADGEAEYRQVVDGNGTSYERRSLASVALPPHRSRAVAMIARYLNVAEATVERVGTERGPRLRVVGRNPRSPGLANASAYRVEAVVTRAGRVEMLEATYAAGDGSTVRAGFRVRDVGSVSVGPPEWYGKARAETTGTGTPTRSSTRDLGLRDSARLAARRSAPRRSLLETRRFLTATSPLAVPSGRRSFTEASFATRAVRSRPALAGRAPSRPPSGRPRSLRPRVPPTPT